MIQLLVPATSVAEFQIQAARKDPRNVVVQARTASKYTVDYL